MAHGPIYRVPLRRRREGKTNYYRRKELMKSGAIRLIIRKSTKHMRVHFVESRKQGDVTLTQANSLQLKSLGWKLSGGNIPAAYITGYYAGKKALKAGITNAILDLGLQSNSKGGRIYATLKGVVDAGIEIPVNEVIFPQEDVLMGSHIDTKRKHVNEEDKDNYKTTFNKYTKGKIAIDKLGDHVQKVKSKIDTSFKEEKS